MVYNIKYKKWVKSSVHLGPQFNGKNSAGPEFELRPKASARALPFGPRFSSSLAFLRFSWHGKLLLARIFDELTCSLSLSLLGPVRTQFHTEMISKGFPRTSTAGLLTWST